ncbi:phosphate ABC transporter permease subunit PstC [candidate division WOR-3 bacterium]|nr:phosphate ABC transporter permease subunit PstC [candidate division WOR-3 bacterium]
MNDRIFRAMLYASGAIIFVLIAGIFLTLFISALPSVKALGHSFLFGTRWNPQSVWEGENITLGAVPFLFGTISTSFLSLLISIPFAFSTALLLGEYMKKGFFFAFLKSSVELLSGIPSVIYGFWGFSVVVPIVRAFEIKTGIPPYGVGIMTASLVLAIMIIPYSASIIREVLHLVPTELKEAAYSLGATRYEVIKNVIFPYARSGISAGLLLALGRALGETMAVTMVIGNLNSLPASLTSLHEIHKTIFSPGNTMSSIIALEFNESSGIHLSALIQMGLLLILVTTIINFIGRIYIKKTDKSGKD